MAIDWSAIRRVALLRRGRLGDLLCAMPVLQLIKRRAPGCQVVVFGDPMQREIVPFLPGIDRFVELPAGERHYQHAVLRGWKHRGGFDLAVSIKTSPKSWNNLFLGMLRPKQCLGFVGNKAFEWLLSGKVAWSEVYAHSHHQALKSLHLLDRELMEFPRELSPRLDLTVARGVWGNWLEKELAFGDEEPLLMTSVTNNRPGSFLGVERTAQLLNRWGRQVRVVVSALPNDKPAAEQLVSLLKMPAKAIVTPALGAGLMLIEAADWLLLGDGGMSHMAAALDRPQLTLFGGTSPIEWAPLSDKCRVLFHRDAVDQIPEHQLLNALSAVAERYPPQRRS